MSRTIRQTALSGLLGSKRFIVSVCAAIAMVLGAMSVGASIFVPQSVEGQQSASNSPLFTEQSGGKNSGASNVKASGSIFTDQRVLVPAGALLQPSVISTPSVNVPKVKAGLSIEFGPVKVSEGISLGGLQVKTDTAALTPTIDVEQVPVTPVEPVVDPPKQEEPPKDTTPPADQTPPAGDSTPMSSSLNASTPPPVDPTE